MDIALLGEQNPSSALTEPHKHSLSVDLAVQALPGACQSLSAAAKSTRQR